MMKYDLFGRFMVLFDELGVLGITIMVLALLVASLLAILRKRTFLVGVYVMALSLVAVAPTTGIASLAVLLRWLVIFLMATTLIYGGRSPGLPVLLLGMMAVYGFVRAPVSPDFLHAVQVSVLLFLVTVPMAMAMSSHLRRFEDVVKMVKVYLLGAVPLAILGVAALPELIRTGGAIGQRFSPAGVSSSGIFVMTAGLMLPVCLWGAVQPELRRWRPVCFLLAATLMMLCLLSGTRGGTFAGLLGCIPLLPRLGLKKVTVSVGVFLLAMAVFFGVLSLMPERATLLYDRYIGNIGTGIYTAGRLDRWVMGIQLCLQHPFLGRGIGSASGAVTGFGMHNAYLKAWRELGIVGLSLFGTAIVMMGVRSFRLITSGAGPRVTDLGRLLFGLVIAAAALGFVEVKLTSPSNAAIFALVMVGVILTRVRAMVREGALQVDYVQAPYAPAEDWLPGEEVVGNV